MGFECQCELLIFQALLSVPTPRGADKIHQRRNLLLHPRQAFAPPGSDNQSNYGRGTSLLLLLVQLLHQFPLGFWSLGLGHVANSVHHGVRNDICRGRLAGAHLC